METSEFEHFRDLILERRHRLTEWLNTPGPERADDARLVRHVLVQIKDALERIDEGSYGCCDVCHEDVERHRLEVQPTAQICLDCISEEEKAALEEDLFLAAKIHRALLPQEVPDIKGFDVEARSLSARGVGGDYYDFPSITGNDRHRVVIADAMGKGLPAGLLMSNLQGALRILSTGIRSPAALLARLNSWLCRNVPVTKFVSLVCLELVRPGAKKTKVRYANAGHCPPLLVRRNGGVEQLAVTGGVLGVHERFTYEEQTLDLVPGDLLMLYTDGVVEAENPRGELFEEERLMAFLRANRSKSSLGIIDSLIENVMNFVGTPQLGDDLTTILLRKK